MTEHCILIHCIIFYSQEEKHHTMLITSYVKWILQSIEDDYNNKTSKEEMRHKLQQLLWQSSFYNVDAVYGEHNTDKDFNRLTTLINTTFKLKSV